MGSVFTEAYTEKAVEDVLFFDPVWRNDTVLFCKKRAEMGSTATCNWLMTLQLPPDNGTTAWHQAEQPFVFHHAEYFESSYIPTVSERLQDQMAGAWIHLLKTGTPNSPILPTWPAVAPQGELATMLFDEKCQVVFGHDEKLLQALKNYTDVGNKGPNLSAYGGGPREGRGVHHVYE